MKNRVLLSWYWSVNFVNNEGFGHSQLGAYFLYLDSSTETLIGHSQLHLPCSDNNQFGNSIKKAFGPNKLVGSSDFLYP